MAITKVGAMTDPPVAGDYTILQAKLDAYAKQIGNQGMILTEWTNTTTAPKIAMGSYITHGGTLFVVDTEDYVVTTAIDGYQYFRVWASGDTLIIDTVSSVVGYSWNAIYNGLYDVSGNQILPYQFNMNAGTGLYEKRKITNLMQGSGFVTVDYTGNVLGSANFGVSGAINGASLGVTGAITGDSVVTTNGPNKPMDNNDASMPSVGIGGFSFAVSSTSTSGVFPSITIGSGGTWVYIANSIGTGNVYAQTEVGRIPGGSSVQGRVAASSGVTAYVDVIAWRIS